MAKKDPRLERAGVAGFNKPKRTPNHPTKSHVVVAKEGDKVKTIRFGQQGVTGDKQPTKRQASFKARHAAIHLVSNSDSPRTPGNSVTHARTAPGSAPFSKRYISGTFQLRLAVRCIRVRGVGLSEVSSSFICFIC